MGKAELDLFFRLANALPVDALLYEMERTVRALRAMPDNKQFQDELTMLCMVYTSKKIIKDEGLERVIESTSNIKRLHEMFTGRSN